MGRHVFEGQNIVRRQPEHPLGFDGPGEFTRGAERQVQHVGGFVVGDDHHYRCLCSPGEKRQIEGARGGGEPGDTFAPRSEGQMPSYALERITVFQVREQLADEGEDHAWFNSNRTVLNVLSASGSEP